MKGKIFLSVAAMLLLNANFSMEAQASEAVVTSKASEAVVTSKASEAVVTSKASEAADNGCEKVGLVLSGGGARGIAEIAVIKVLEDNDIPIDYITGTSIGSIVGGLYAAGYSPDEMMQLVTSPMFLDASNGKLEPKESYLFFEPEPTPAMLNVDFNSATGKMSSILPSSLVSPMPMNFAFMQVFSPYTAQCGGNFDKLFVPLRTVASNMKDKSRYVFSGGQLSSAVRSSMSYPIVFKPVVLGDTLMYDGGIFDNYPFDVMKDDFNPDVMIGVDIHSTDKPTGFPNIMYQFDMLVTRPNNYNLPADYGIDMRIDLNRFSLMDFTKADEIYAIGYQRATEMIDSIKSRITTRRPKAEVEARRELFKAATPRVVFDSVNVTGASASQNAYIEYLFKNGCVNDTISLESAMENYSKILSTKRFVDLDPRAIYNPHTGHFNLRLKADIKPDMSFGVGAYVTSTPNSMLYLSGGYHSLSFRSMDANLSAWIGQSYMAAKFDTRMMLRHKHDASIGIEGVVWRQKYSENERLFFQSTKPAFVSESEAFVRAKYSHATGRHGRIDAGIGFDHQHNRFYNIDEPVTIDDPVAAHTNANLGQVLIRWERSTLDNLLFPTAGGRLRVMGQGVLGKYNHRGTYGENYQQTHSYSTDSKWLQLEADYTGYIKSGKFSLGLSTSALLSTRKLSRCYDDAIVNASAFVPTANAANIFNPMMRANSYVSAGLIPIWSINDMFALRCSAYAFSAIRPIERTADGEARYARGWMGRPRWYVEPEMVVRLPFGNLSVYGTYKSAPDDRWSVGISFGKYFIAPKFLRL